MCVMKQRFAGSGVVLYHDSVPNSEYNEDSWWEYSGGWFRVAREIAALGWYSVRHGLSPWSC